MTLVQFNFCIEKLKSVYGANKYPQARLDILFSRFERISGTAFAQGIDNLIINCKYAPMLEEFYAEFASELQEGKVERVAELVERNPCVICKNTGRLSVSLKPEQADYAFRCKCKIGSVLFPNYPIYDYRRAEVDRV